MALLLPLTGKAEAAGQALLNAAQLSLFDAGQNSVELIVLDTGDTPEGAASAMQQATTQGAQLVLGPLFSTQIDAVKPLAEAANINVISFSNDETKAGGNVFVMGVSPRAAAKRIVSFALSRGLPTIAVIAPNTPFGQETVKGAQEAAAAGGGSIGPVVLYDTTKLDLSDDVQQLGTGFSAVLAPEGGKRLIGLAPLLAYFDIDPLNVKYLGSALWQDPQLGVEPNLTGAWFPAPAIETWEAFRTRYNEAYQTEPPRVASLAYDGVALAALLARGAPSADPLGATPGQWIGLDKRALTSASGFAGVDGIFRFLPDNKIERGLAIYEMQRDGFPLIEPAPGVFTAAIY